MAACSSPSAWSAAVENRTPLGEGAVARDALGCTLTETELTCQRRSLRKRTRAGASSFSFAAVAELGAASTSSEPLQFSKRASPMTSADKKP
jgi:hypothetical protein